MSGAMKTATAFILALSVTLAAAQAPQAAPDEALWRSIETLIHEVRDNTAPVDRRRDRLEALAAMLERYLTFYPGGPKRDEAVERRFSALYELGVMSGGRFERLCGLVESCQHAPPSPHARVEADYWAILCRSLNRSFPATQPAFGRLGRTFDDELIADYADFIRTHPASGYAPRLAETVLAAAAQRGDVESVRPLIVQMARSHPESAAVERVLGALARHDAIGRRFVIDFTATDGRRIDSEQWLGRPVLVVVWSRSDPGIGDLLSTVERLRAEAPDLAVVGVNLDEPGRKDGPSPAWPQWNDGLGHAHGFVRQWGIDGAGWVFVVGRDGRLLEVARDERWRRAAARALQD